MRILISIALLVFTAGSAIAQQTVAQAKARLGDGGIPGEKVAEIAALLNGKADSSGNTVVTAKTGKSVKLQPNAQTSANLSVSSSSTDETTITFGDSAVTRPYLAIHGSTTDGDDDGYIIIGPGGSNSIDRGAAIVMYGNEASNDAGTLKLDAGSVPGAMVEIITAETPGVYRRRWYASYASGNWNSEETYGGSVVFNKGGTGVKLTGGATNDAWAFLTTECNELSTTGATTQTWASALPAYAVMFALTGRVTEAYTSGGTITSLHVGNGSTANQYANALALTSGTTWTSPETGAAGGVMPQSNAAAAQNIVVTANGGGTITAGKMRLCVTYMRSQVPQS